MSAARLVRSGSIRRVRDTLVVKFRENVRVRALSCGIPPGVFRDWVDGVVGEGIAVALSHLDRWDEERGDFLTWAHLKTTTLIRDELRKERQHFERRDTRSHLVTEKLCSRSLDPLRILAMREQLLAVFEKLPKDQANAVMLYYLLGYSVKEIASLTGKPNATVYTLLRRGRERIAKANLNSEL